MDGRGVGEGAFQPGQVNTCVWMPDIRGYNRQTEKT